MMRIRCIALALLALLPLAMLAAQEKNLLALAADLGAVVEWDPLRDAGVISFGSDRISLAIGADAALVNYRLKVAIDPPVRRDGAVWLTTTTVKALSDAVQKDRLAHAAEHLRVAYILIDPGHGGRDSGAVGEYVQGKKTLTVMEKDIALQTAQALVSLLNAAFPDKEIMLTRDRDDTVALEDRPPIGNALLEKTNETVLWISIHANAKLRAGSTAKGFEVWYLPPQYSRTLLDEGSAGDENRDILPILNSMLEEEISLESTVLAQEILKGLEGKIGDRTDNRGLRQNDWYVVRNARMPAVLVEVGFVSSPEEAARLADAAYLRDIAEGMYDGVRGFIAQFEKNGSNGAR
jgi:N-acetylmuramoyl-L-alanine amidase